MPLPRKDGAGAPPAAGPRRSPARPPGGRGKGTPPHVSPAPPAGPAAPPRPPTGGGGDEWGGAPLQEVARPPNQLALSAAELVEEVGRSLTTGNPCAPASLVRYSFRDRGFRADPIIDQQVQHLALGGCLLHRDSDEAARERHRRESVALLAQSRRVTAQSRRATHVRASEVGGGGGLRAESSLGPAPSAAHLGGGPLGASASVAGGAGGEGEEGEEGAAARLRNQFNYADRAAQTGPRAPRERGTQTEPPPTATAAGSCSRWEVFEAYVADQDRQRQTEQLASHKAQLARREARQAAAGQHQHQQQRGSGGGGGAPGAGALALPGGDGGGSEGEGLGALPAAAARLLERMVCQNLHEEVTMDFKYWDDPADAVRPDEGTLLPLWSFDNPAAKRRAVTALAWSPRYADLFAVGYGSFDFLRPTTGLVAVYSLKSPAHPEFSLATGAGVMCLDFHPDHPALLATGCYDGHVTIFDVRAGGEPLYRSSPRSGKHSDPVWQVRWQRTDSHELQLVSISTDGRVTLWTASKDELTHQDLLELRSLRARGDADTDVAGGGGGEAGDARGGGGAPRPSGSSVGAGPAEGGDGGERAVGIAGGCCFDFSPDQESLFVVGAEDGSLFKCSTAYASEWLQAYRPGHRLPVYAVRWSPLHPRAFLSSGADWRVKLWDSLQAKPVMSWDLGAPVGDVAWAPFSSTVFAAATDAGRVHVFDLERGRGAAACAQRVARKARLTKLAFNERHPVLLVGTEQGSVLCLKLSPNLHRSFNQGAVDQASGRLARTDSARAATRGAEAARLDAVLGVAAKCNAAIRPEDWDLM